MVAVFTHSSICPSLLRPQSVFSAPGASLRAESFCKQRERERRARQCNNLTGLPRVNRPWSHMEHERRWQKSHGSLVRTLWIYRWPLEPDRTLTHSSEVCQKNNFILQTWLSVQHLHQWVGAAGASGLPVSSDRKLTEGCCQTSAEQHL